MSRSTSPEQTPRKERLEPGSLLEQRQTLLETCSELLRTGDEAALRLVLNSHHAADLADLVRRLKEEEGTRVLGLLSPVLAARTLAAADTATALVATGAMNEGMLTAIVSQMAPDDAADLLAELPSDLGGRVLVQMEAELAVEIEKLLAHAEESGGGIMTSRLVAVRDSITVSDAVHYLREWAGDEEILSLFVVDDDGRLTGTLSLRRMLLAEPETLISELVEPDPISVQVDVDQEEIARIFAEYDLLAVPVVEEGGELVGQVTVDDIVDVIREEATEDIYEMAAMSSEEIGERSTLAVMRRRLPWLLLCLAGTLACGAVIDRFEDLLSRIGALILFVPAIMAMGGNSGIQTSTVTVRSLATGEFPQRNLLLVVWRELRTAVGMGLFFGLLVGGVAGMWSEAGIVAACVGTAMAAAITLSALLGAVVPLVFRALGIDPAVSSGPLITTLNDVLSLAIYFAIAAAVLQLWN